MIVSEFFDCLRVSAGFWIVSWFFQYSSVTNAHIIYLLESLIRLPRNVPLFHFLWNHMLYWRNIHPFVLHDSSLKHLRNIPLFSSSDIFTRHSSFYTTKIFKNNLRNFNRIFPFSIIIILFSSFDIFTRHFSFYSNKVFKTHSINFLACPLLVLQSSYKMRFAKLIPLCKTYEKQTLMSLYHSFWIKLKQKFWQFKTNLLIISKAYCFFFKLFFSHRKYKLIAFIFYLLLHMPMDKIYYDGNHFDHHLNYVNVTWPDYYLITTSHWCKNYI